MSDILKSAAALYNAGIMDSVNETAHGMYDAGVIDDEKLEEFNKLTDCGDVNIRS